MQTIFKLIHGALRDLVPLVQFKNEKNIHGEGLLLGPATLLKVFLRFLNCTNGTKSRKASHMFSEMVQIQKKSCRKFCFIGIMKMVDKY